MLSRFSIKTQLTMGAALTLLIILVLGGSSIYGTRQGSAALADVYGNNVQPLILLQQMGATLKEVRFRMAAVPLDQMSIKGSHDQLKEARDSLPKLWEEFKKQAALNSMSKEDKEAFDKVDNNFANLNTLLEKLDTLYGLQDKNALLPPLQEDWPKINRRMAP